MDVELSQHHDLLLVSQSLHLWAIVGSMLACQVLELIQIDVVDKENLSKHEAAF